MQRFDIAGQRPVHTVVQYPYTIAGQKDHLMSRLEEQGQLSFAEVIGSDPVRIAVIFNFLAILELVQAGKASLHYGSSFNDFRIGKAVPEAEAAVKGNGTLWKTADSPAI